MNMRDHWIIRGIRFDEPAVIIPWRISEERLQDFFAEAGLKRIVPGYYTSPVVFSQTVCNAGFHFENGRLCQVELFRADYSGYSLEDWKNSFYEFETMLTRAFGPPHETQEGNDDELFILNAPRRRFGGVKIMHYIWDRFGYEERISISKNAL